MSGKPRRMRVVLDLRGAHDLEGMISTLGAAVEVHEEDGLGRVEATFPPELPEYLEDRVEAWLHWLDPSGTNRLETMLGSGPWEDGWRAFYRGGPIGDTFAVHPPWVEPDSERLSICIDPRGAFGSGAHPSTRAVLQVFAEVLPRDPQPAPGLLDVGSGTGVLAIAAARLGLRPTALELDPTARESCRRCCEANGVEVRVLDLLLEELDELFPYVAANLVVDTLRSLSGDLIRVTEPGGTLILSGLRPEQVEDVVQAFAPCALDGTYTAQPRIPHQWSSAWTALVLRAPQR